MNRYLQWGGGRNAPPLPLQLAAESQTSFAAEVSAKYPLEMLGMENPESSRGREKWRRGESNRAIAD